MKISQFLPFVCLGSLVISGAMQASAQAPDSGSQNHSATPGMTRVFVTSSKINNGRSSTIFVLAANDRGMKFKTTAVETVDTTLPLKEFDNYFVFEPVEFREAYDLFQDRKYPEAIKAFQAVAEQQKSLQDLPFNYTGYADFYIAECHRRMMNVAEMEKIDTARLKSVLPMESCLIQSDIYDLWKKSFKKEWPALQKGVEAVFKAKKNLSNGQRAQLLYLLGLAYDGQNKIKEAIDTYAEAMLIDGAASPEISRPAVEKSLEIYMKNPELIEFFKTNPGPDARIVPGIVREAAGLAGVWTKVFNFKEALPQKFQVLLPFRIEPPKPTPPAEAPAKPADAAKDAKAPAAPADGAKPAPAAPAPAAGATPAPAAPAK